MHRIKVTHTAATFKQFQEWGVQQAFPNFYVNLTIFIKEDNEILCLL